MAGWGILACWVAAYDLASAARGRPTMSGVARRHPAVTALGWGLLACHFARPDRWAHLDPLSCLHRRVTR